MDKMTSEQRSALMGRIRSKDTKPELAVRKLVHGLGYRYVLHDRRLPGTPDLVFPARRKVLFVHGCFWHGHSCGRGFKPKSNTAFWAEKIKRNSERDSVAMRLLAEAGWDGMCVWECEIVASKMDSLASRLIGFLDA